MNDKISTSSLQAIELFRSVVKAPLQTLLNGEVFSVEEESQAESPIAQVLDMAASSDLVVKYQTTTAAFLAASRLLYCDETHCEYPLSLTLRNTVSGAYEVTELNKLQRAVSILESGIPVIVPRYLCFARIFPKTAPKNLYDLLAVETIPLIRHVFSAAQLNLPQLRRQMESGKKSEVLLDPGKPALAGIRTSENNTFLFISKRYLDMHSLPYLYRKEV